MAHAQHTPGPWEVLTGLRTVIRGAVRQTVAEITVPYGDDLRGHRVTKANAALIAAAPDLLAALDTLMGLIEMTGPRCIADYKLPIEAARAAIAKAKGEVG